MKGVGSHSGIGRIQDSESRFREILDRVSRYIAGYVDAPMVVSRYLHLPDIFSPIRETPLQSSSPQNITDINIITPFENEPQITPQRDVSPQVRTNLFIEVTLNRSYITSILFIINSMKVPMDIK
jgi:hypothetical protein